METDVLISASNNISDIANIVMAIASVISLIVSIINVLVVVWIFKKERKDSKDEYKHAQKENWYNSLGIKNITVTFSEKINELKNLSIDYFNNKVVQDEYIKAYKQLDEEFLKYKNEFLTFVDCVDGPLQEREISNEFEQIQDDLYKLVTLMLGDKTLKSISSSQDIIIKFDDIRKKIIKMSIAIYEQ